MHTRKRVVSNRSEQGTRNDTDHAKLECPLLAPIAPVPAADHSPWRFAVPIALAALVFLAYIPALDAGLVDWDDDDLLMHTTAYRSLSLDSLRWMFTTSLAGHFQPLTWLSYWFDWSLWHREWFGFHLTNVTLHAMTAIMFYFIARRLLASSAGEIRSGPIVVSAGLAAAVFALHPLRVESVVWLAERRDVLGGLFYVLAVWFHIRFVGGSQQAGFESASNRATVDESTAARAVGADWRRMFYVGTIACCMLSLMSKATAVTLPLVLLVLDVYPLRRLQRGATMCRLLIEKSPLLLLGFCAAWWAITAQNETGAMYPLAEHGLAARLAQACHGLIFYASKTLWPTQLGPLYEIPATDVLFGPTLWLSAALILLTIAAAFALRRRAAGVLAALAVYVVVLFPVLGVLQSGPQFVADRYSYISCMGFALLAGAMLLRVFGSRSWGWRSPRRSLVALVSTGLIVLITHATFAQANHWLSPYTLWRHGVRVSPNSAIAHANYGDALAGLDLPDAAARHYQRALELDPNDVVALHHWGNLHRQAGDTRSAIAFYVRALAINPNRLNACLSLAETFLDTGRPREALAVLTDGARRHPQSLRVIRQLSTLLATHRDKTIRNPERALRLAMRLIPQDRQPDARPPDPADLLILATAYAAASRFDEAETVARQALALAEADQQDRLAAELRRRIELFATFQPYINWN